MAEVSATGSGRAWFITGVGSGLGQALAEAALGRGDRVAGTVRRVDQLKPFEARAPGRARGYLLDVTDEAALSAAIHAFEAEAGRIDVLVNNAGYGLVGAVEETAPDELRAQFETNVLAPLAAIRAALPAMRARRGGVVVNVTSVSGLAVWAGTGAYSSSKFALQALGETLADEVAAFGVTVMNVAPGGLRTDYAGRSLRPTQDRIADYEATARFAEHSLSGNAGRESGDPARAAQAILQALDAPHPPRTLLLGADAIHYATQRAGRMQVELGEWIGLSLSIAHPPG